MTIPLVTENKWRCYLKKLPLWSPPPGKMIILSPHPDDETLSAGGLISDLRQNNTDVRIIAITDGEQAYKDIKLLGLIRKKEQELALKTLGIAKEHIIRLGLKDSTLHSAERVLEQRLVPFIEPNTHLLAPWSGDFHPDHEAVGRVAAKIAREYNILLSFYFFWTWHQASFSTITSLPLQIYPLTAHALHQKQLALNCYRSQQNHFRQHPILPKHLLGPAKRPFEVYYTYENTSR